MQAARNLLGPDTHLIPTSCLFFQEYHNLRAAAFNSQAQELGRKTEDQTNSRSAYFVSFISCGGASAHPLGVVPEIRADC